MFNFIFAFLLYLLVKFQNGEKKIYGMNDMLKFDYYKNLRYRQVFKTVCVCGITLKWCTGEDIASEKIYFDSVPLAEFWFKVKEMK